MKFRLFFAWYDLWVGAFWDRKSRTLYLALIPTIVLSIEMGEEHGTRSERGQQ